MSLPRAAETASIVVMIATPLEPALVEQMRAVDPRLDVRFESELLPPIRYPCDHRGVEGFARDAASEARWHELLAQAEVMLGIPRESPLELAATIPRAPKLRWLQAMYAGAGEQVRAASLDAQTLARVAFTSAAGIHAGMLAEFVFFGVLALRKDFRRLERLRAARFWDHYASGELAGATIAIVGLGGIGRAIARLAQAFGMHVIGITRDGAPRRECDQTFAWPALAEGFARADVAAITLPATPQSRGLVDRRALAALPPNAIVANVGRGHAIDQTALIEALERGALAGAVLDVFEPEPLPPENPLWTMQNVVFSPHTMALSVHENERIVAIFCENLRRYLAGEPLRNRIDPETFV
ncbi:MAG: D-2-hydroxyacid dehydrogenase [Vulcanimicrobiaceae bacterium]